MPDRLASTTDRSQRRPLSVWDLPASLLTSAQKFRKRTPKSARDRSHFPAILAFVHRNRFVTASQVQRRFATTLKSDRTTRRHLAEMQESLGYLDLIPTASPLWPKVYAVSRFGLRKLAQSVERTGRRWEPSAQDRKRRQGFSVHHVVHELFVSEFLLAVWESAHTPSGIELLLLERRSLAKHPAFQLAGSPTARLIPDAMFLIRHRDCGAICTFLEIDTGSMGMPQITEKLSRYEKWSASHEANRYLINKYRKCGAKSPRSVFRIAMVCGSGVVDDDCKRLVSVRNCVRDKHASLLGRVWLTTAANLRSLCRPGFLFRSPIWQSRVHRDKWDLETVHGFFGSPAPEPRWYGASRT